MDIFSECESSLHEMLVVIVVWQGNCGDNWKPDGTLSLRFCFWLLLFNLSDLFYCLKEENVFITPLCLPQSKTENRTLPVPSLGQADAGPILKVCPLEEGVQLIPICSGICRVRYRLSYILKTPLRMASYLKGMNEASGCKSEFGNCWHLLFFAVLRISARLHTCETCALPGSCVPLAPDLNKINK